ncbi:MAG TPA: GspH/FimT family pseudopilin [Rhodocyclaceae bacterium]|nr:GspH/FimT family pseudopilin [Rhodocyclaceae bacterium]
MSLQKSALARRMRVAALAAGFTLIELIVVMVILGIMAIAIVPRFADKSVFESRGFRDETVSLLRYAQKSAVAQRRTVCVTVAATGVTLQIAAAAEATNCVVGDPLLTLPSTPRTGSGLAGDSFNFLPSGATSGANTLTLTVSGANDIQIDAVTGYVR